MSVTRDPAAFPAPDLATPEPVRLGLVALATDLTSEHDLLSLLPDNARLHVSRVAYANPITPQNLAAMAPHIGAAADLLVPGVALAAVGFGCTSGAVVIGEAAIAAAIGSVRPGVAVFTPAGAAVDAFHALGVRRIALLTPYTSETAAVMTDHFINAGLDVVQSISLDMADDRDIARLAASAIRSAARCADHLDAEALFISCTAMPVLPLIDEIEAALGKPMITSNQVLGWAMLGAAGVQRRGPGRLFAVQDDAA